MYSHTRSVLEDGLAKMSLELSDDKITKLDEFVRLLDIWNQKFNLTAIRDKQEMVVKHLLDSLAVLPHIGKGNICDVGSGAGLPGIPLAITSPDNHFSLVDSNGKKTRFLTQAKINLKLENTEVFHTRIEQHHPEIRYDVIIARAYANVDKILTSTKHLQDDATRILIMQGKPDENIGIEGYVVTGMHRLQVAGLDAERHLVEINKVGT